MTVTTSMWIIFNLLIAALLYIDLGILNKKAHAITIKEAVPMVAAWIAVAMAFNAFIYLKMGAEPALSFLTCYIIEYSLSMDNMFVFVMIFSYFAVPPKYQPRVLHWGILGAVVMRLILILAGVKLVHAFGWLLYIFGAILIYTAIKMMTHDGAETDPGANPVLKLLKKVLPFTDKNCDDKFFIKEKGLLATPLFATLIVIETSDLIFAVDSIPAVLGISQDSFIVYSSNVFAIMGLRALYFLLAGMMNVFSLLKYGIGIILFFVGAKMLLAGVLHITIGVSLAVVIMILAASMLGSLVKNKYDKKKNSM